MEYDSAFDPMTAPLTPRGAALQKAAYAGQDVRRGEPDVPPITAFAMQHLVVTGHQAQEIASRLFELRDRLFGPSPVGGSTLNEKQVPANGFVEAYQRQAGEVSSLIATIDHLSAEIANRL